MTFEKKLEPGAGCLHARFGALDFALSGQHIGKAPIHLRITNRHYGPEELLRLAGVSFSRANLGQMHSRFCVHWEDRDGPSIPCAGKSWVRLRGQFAPKHAELKANPGDGERRDVAICLQGVSVSIIGRIEVAKIDRKSVV